MSFIIFETQTTQRGLYLNKRYGHIPSKVNTAIVSRSADGCQKHLLLKIIWEGGTLGETG